jgi:hypothetical protein
MTEKCAAISLIDLQLVKGAGGKETETAPRINVGGLLRSIAQLRAILARMELGLRRLRPTEFEGRHVLSIPWRFGE